MRRHPELIPISREHHPMLLLAQLLKKDAPPYRGLPTTLDGKASYAVNIYESFIRYHFTRENEVLFPEVKALCPGLVNLSHELEQDHQQMAEIFRDIAEQQYDEDTLHHLGSALELHIRKEERFFF
ncbi:MAG: hemerythrin domain-containing protein [Bacteroidia bacterium]|nr:hemerythrin domain-containing protein [Bacteroidia bacterium]